MTYGLHIINPASELVLSSDAYLPGYLGKASHVGTTAATASDGGYCTFTITSSKPIIPVVEMTTGNACNVLGYSQAGSTWTIAVTNGNPSALDARGFFIQTPPVVHVFGFPVSAAGWGLALYGPDGSIRADLSKRPFKAFARASWGSGNNLSAALSGIPARMGLVGRLSDSYLRYTRIGASTDIRSYGSALRKWPSNPTQTLERVQEQRERSLEDWIGQTDATRLSPLTGIAIDLTGFPT